MHGFMSRFRPFFLSAAVFSLVMNMLMLAPALFMLQVFDRVLTSLSIETLVMLLLLVVVALLCMSFLDMIRQRLLASAAVTLEKLIGTEVLTEMIRLRASPAQDKVSAGLRDINTVRAFLTGPGIISIFDAPWVPIYVFIIALFHPWLGALAFVGAIILLAMAIVNERFSRRPLAEMQRHSTQAGRFADQSIANAEVARALGMEADLSSGWANLSRKGLHNQLQVSRVSSNITSTTRFIRQFLQVAMLATGAFLVIDQQATAGVMIAATILLGRALAPVESAIAGWKGMVDARRSYAQLQTMFESHGEKVAVTELPDPIGAVRVEGVVFAFRGRDRPVIKPLSFELAAGQTLAIVGPSAAGKSTLARLIMGLWKPTVGAVRLDGADIFSWPRESLAPHIGYLPQNVELFAGTVSENIARMGEVNSAMVIEAARQAQLHELILQLPKGYETPIGDGGAFLSAGQRQRVALARALYGKPRLIVLDEPNSNLDGDGEAALLEAIQQMKANGTTLVIITHRSKLLINMDRILVMRDGMLDKFGPPEEIFMPPPSNGGLAAPRA
jgi:PrtD family type I secretion system ABC transporter